MTKSISSSLHIRRHEPTRLEGFVDAAFAFAITLIVIAVGHVPDTVSDMLHALRDVPTFAVCFWLIARIWKSHRDFSRVYGLDDATTTWLSLLLVFVVLIYVYPLRILFGSMFASFGSGWLSTQDNAVHSYFELRAAFVVFGIGYAAIWCVFALLYRHALRLRAIIGLGTAEIEATRFQLAMNMAFAAVAVLSVTLAMTLPFATQPKTVGLPGFVYLLMSPIAIGLARHWRRRIDALPDSA
ncbi:MAG TPA: TMEM175 family protein [Rudaea sp.]|nr:TMEM175 family protein [Rudaea sp.]